MTGEGLRATPLAAVVGGWVVMESWVADPAKDLAAVMIERFGDRHGYVGHQYGLGD